MAESLQDELRSVWISLARRNEWVLIPPAAEETFLNDAANEYHALIESKPHTKRLHTALTRTYAQRLYRGLWHREEQAAHEIWSAFMRTAYRKQWAEDDAQEIAQETVARVLTHLAMLNSPPAFFSWAFQIFRTVQREYIEKQSPKSDSDALPIPIDDELAAHIPDPFTIDDHIVEKLVNEEVLQLLRASLQNELQLQVLLRVVLFETKPQAIAQELGHPPHIIRLAKSRALKHIREDIALAQQLRSILDS